jgi:hypothetical protein
MSIRITLSDELNVELLVEVAPVVDAGQAINEGKLAHHVGLELQRQVCLDARAHHGRVDGLGDEVHRAKFERVGLLHRVVVHGDEDDGNVLGQGIGLEAPADFKTVHHRHHDIEQHHVRLFVAALRQGLLAAGGHEHIAVGAKDLVQDIDVVRLVVHHQKPRSRRWGVAANRFDTDGVVIHHASRWGVGVGLLDSSPLKHRVCHLSMLGRAGLFAAA